MVGSVTRTVDPEHLPAPAARCLRYSTAQLPPVPRPTALQAAYQRSLQILTSNHAPTREQFLELCSYFGRLQLADVGLATPDLYRERSAITYIKVFGCAEFDICIFIMPAGAVIPLHDHHGMTVLCKMLAGTVDAVVYDGRAPDQSPAVGPEGPTPLAGYGGTRDVSAYRAAGQLRGRRLFQGAVTPTQGPLIVWPGLGNLHELRARTASAFIDLQAPPYDEAGGRDCRYYRPAHPSADGEEVLLEEVPSPRTAYVQRPYTGPPVLGPGIP